MAVLHDAPTHASRGSVIAAVAAVVVMAVLLALLYGVYIHEIQRSQAQAHSGAPGIATRQAARAVPTTAAELARWHRNDEVSTKGAEKATPDLP